MNYLGKNFLINKLISEIGNKIDGTIILFGSFAKDEATEESDVDLFVISDKRLDMNTIRETGDLVNKEITIKPASKNQVLKGLMGNDPLIMEVFSNHIILKGIDNFCEIMWRYYAKQ